MSTKPNAAYENLFRAERPRRSDYSQLQQPDDLARILLAYFAAFAIEAGFSTRPVRPVVIALSTARRIGKGQWLRFSGVPHQLWMLPYSPDMGVDEAGNGFLLGPNMDDTAAHLSFDVLCRMSPDRLKRMLEDCNPFGPG